MSIDTKPIVEWLVDGARSAQESEEVLAELCARLVAAGIPFWRVSVFVRTLHPEIMGRRFTWIPGVPVETTDAAFDVMDTPQFTRSPVLHVYQTRMTLRRRIEDPATPNDFPVLDDFRAEGVTDYLAMPLLFTTGEIHVVTMTTRAPGGFTWEQIEALEGIMPALARVAEVRVPRRTAVNLLNTYVGNVAGGRILAGQIRRGHTERIHAAIWHSDMRGFTTLADRLPPEQLIGVLNRYFDCQVPAITARGGEVLKYIGDGLLAIFPIPGQEARARVCGEALAAAQEARANVAALAEKGDLPAGASVRFGLALHIGEVLYGNIGSGNRLDFTCIGPAVNLAARLEELTSELGRVVLASAEFAQSVRADLQPVGEYPVRGLAGKQTVFGLSDEGR